MAPFTLELDPMTEDAKILAEKELRETPEVVAAALKELREYLANDDTIFYDMDDDDILKVFLRPCKFYAKSAYELMKRIADFKQKYKSQLDGLLPADERAAFIDHNVVNVLKERDHKGRRVLIVNVGGTWNTTEVTADQLFRIFYLVHIAATLEIETQVQGVVVIMDFNGLSMKQVMALSPQFGMKLMGFIQEAMPLRLKEVHMVKNPFISKLVWKFFSPFVQEKLKKRIMFHGSKMSSLHKYMEPSHLPKDYDGDLPPIDYSGGDWYPCIEGHLAYYEKFNTWGLKNKKE